MNVHKYNAFKMNAYCIILFLSSVLPLPSWSRSQASVRATGSLSSVHALVHHLVGTSFTVWTPSLLPTSPPLQLHPPPRPSSQTSQIWFSPPPRSPVPLLPLLPLQGKCTLNVLSFKGKARLRSFPMEREKQGYSRKSRFFLLFFLLVDCLIAVSLGFLLSPQSHNLQYLFHILQLNYLINMETRAVKCHINSSCHSGCDVQHVINCRKYREA